MGKKVIIIGAGTIGLHCAYYLHEKGCEVEVLEARNENDETGCSYGNCGLIVPSHFVPFASPAMLKSGMKMLFDPKSPVSIPLRKNLGYASWFLKFMMAANSRRMQKAIPMLYSLNNESKRLYEQLCKARKGELAKQGLLMAAATSKGWKEELEMAKMADDLGIETTVMDEHALKRLEPDVDFNITGAVLYNSDAHLLPELHLRWLKKELREKGVAFCYNTTVDNMILKKGRIKSVDTSLGRFKADEFVLASGALSGTLANKLGLKIPLIPGKGYSFDMSRNELPLRTPVILTEAKLALTPFDSKVRLGSGMEINGELGRLREKRIKAMLQRTNYVFPKMNEQDASQLEVWEGLRPLTPSGLPYICRTQKFNNLLLATGHAMMGVSLAPVTGKIISQLVLGEKPEFEMQLLQL